MSEAGVFDKTALVFGQMDEPPGTRLRVALSALTIAEYFRDVQQQHVLLFIAILGVDELSEEDKIVVNRARRIQQFLSQNTYMAEKFTGVEGSTVPLRDTIESFSKIADGEYDHVAEQAFFNVGGIDDVERKW